MQHVQSQRGITNATKWILQFQRLTKPSTGVKAELMRQLYISVAIPKMTYMLDVWYTLPVKLVGAKRISSGTPRYAKSAQSRGTSNYRSTEDNPKWHTGHTCRPVTDRTDPTKDHTQGNGTYVDTTQPFHRIMKNVVRAMPTKHLLQIDNLTKLFWLNPDSFEKIHPASESYCRPRAVATTIATRGESMEEEKQDKVDFKIFTDGSGDEENMGVAAVMYKKGQLYLVLRLTLTNTRACVDRTSVRSS